MHCLAAGWFSFQVMVGFQLTGVLTLTSLIENGSIGRLAVFLAVGGSLSSILGARKLLQLHKNSIDGLTGVLNHKALERRLGDELGQAARNQNIVAVLFVNVDRFKSVNEVHGHEAGDTLLENVARRLRENVRSNDLVGRVGGDEFMVVLTGLRQPDPVSKIAEKLVDVLNQPFSINGKIIKVTASIGIAFYPEDGSTAKALTNSSNNAMLAVKDRSRNSFVFSDQGMRVEHTRRIMLERLLPQALAEDELELAFQPQIDLQDNSLIGFEALLRWRNKELGQVSPAEFIPIAEDSGLIVPIGQWVLREACHQAMDWQRKGLRPVKMAVNVSWVQFQQQNFLNSVGLALRDSGLDSRLLEIEITEGVLMKNGDMAKELLTSLTRHGVDIALDDFGTGYSSLAYLQDFPIKNLKIDRSFVAALSISADGRLDSSVPIIEAICAMAFKLDKTITVEGIETEPQRHYLKGIGCHHAQGYLFSKPLNRTQAEELQRRLILNVPSPPTRQREVATA